MERFKRHTDPATGVNPFVTKLRPAAGSVYLGYLFFPLRLILSSVLLLLIFVLEMPLHLLRKFGLQALGNLVLHPLIAILLKLYLLILGNMTVSTRPFPIRPTLSVYSSASSNPDKKKPVDDNQMPPGAGDLVVANMQSPLDILVLTSLGILGGWSLPTAMVVFPLPDGNTVIFQPSPFQKVKVMRHVLWTGSKRFFSQCSKKAASTAEVKVDVTMVQRRAKRLGVPVVYFAEGTCTTGQAVLKFPRFSCEGQMHLVALQYSNPVVTTVVKKTPAGGTKFLAQCSSGIWGLFGVQRCTISIVRPSNVPPVDSSFSPAWSDMVREKIVAAASSLGTNVVCKAVASGFVEKEAFLDHFWETAERDSAALRQKSAE